MIFYVNRLLADDSHVISYLIFCRKFGKMSQNLSSAAVVIGALRVNCKIVQVFLALIRTTSSSDGTQGSKAIGSEGGSLPRWFSDIFIHT